MHAFLGFNCLKKAMYKVERLAATGQASCGTPSAVPSSHHKHSSHWVLSVSQESKSYKTENHKSESVTPVQRHYFSKWRGEINCRYN